MDLVLNVNGMKQNLNLKQNINQHKKVDKKDLHELENIEENNRSHNKFKQEIIDIQNSFNAAQNKINTLQIANEHLNNISSSLDKFKNSDQNSPESLKQLNLQDELKRLQKIQEDVKELLNNDKDNASKIMDEFSKISSLEKAINKIQIEKKDLNTALNSTSILNEVNQTIASVSSTQNELSEIENDLMTSIKSLGITLENLIASNSKIRNIDEVEVVSKITQENILKEAQKSINLQVIESAQTLNELFY